MLVLNNRLHYESLKSLPVSRQPYNNELLKPKSSEKICPIRVLHQKLSKPQDIQRKLTVRASKHVYRLAAVGPETLESLYHIQNARNVKTIRKFEFDPYLADRSCLSALLLTTNRLKSVREANIVIRRLDKKDVATRRSVMIHKISRLTKLRGEFVYDGTFTAAPNFYLQYISKCYSLRSLTLIFVNLPFAYDRACYYMASYRAKLLRLEEYQLVKYKTYEMLNAHEQVDLKLAPFRLDGLKKFSICIGLKPGWMSITDDFIKTNFEFLNFFNRAKKLEELNIKFIKFPTILEFMAAFIEVLPLLPNLKRLKLNFMRTHIGDIEIIELIESIHKFKSLKQLTLKIFQYPNISGDAIRYLVSILSKHESLEKFDFYARRLDLLNEQIDELVEDVCRNSKVQCSRFKQSFHAYMDKQLEN